MTTPLSDDADINHECFWNHFLTDVIQNVRWMRVPSNDIHDIVHQIVQKTQQKWHTRRNCTVAGTRAWVHSITRTTVADYFRRHRRDQNHLVEFATSEAQDQALEEIESPHPYFNAVEWLQQQQREQLLWEAVLSLKEIDYNLVKAYYYDEKNQRDIAEEFGLPYDMVKKRLQRVLIKLWKHLKAKGVERENW